MTNDDTVENWSLSSFLLAVLFLLYVLFETKLDRTVKFYYCTALPIICTVLKKQACNNYKYWSYNRNLRVLYSSKFSANHMYQTYNKYMDYISAFTLLSIFIRITWSTYLCISSKCISCKLLTLCKWPHWVY